MALACTPLACASEDAPQAVAASSSTPTTATSVGYSRSGAWIVRRDPATGTSQPWVHLDRLSELTAMDAYEATVELSPDGSTLALAATGSPGPGKSGASASGLYLASTSRPDDVRKMDAGLASVGSATFSPDGRWLAVLGDNTLALVPTGGGAAVRTSSAEPLPYPQGAEWSADGRRLTVTNGTNRGEPWNVVFDVDPVTGTTSSVAR